MKGRKRFYQKPMTRPGWSHNPLRDMTSQMTRLDLSHNPLRDITSQLTRPGLFHDLSRDMTSQLTRFTYRVMTCTLENRKCFTVVVPRE